MSECFVECDFSSEDISFINKISDFNLDNRCVYESVKSELANRRVGTASVKGRSEVIGSNRKPWAQKGTGRARAGSVKSPLWRGGGVIFPPKPRNYSYSLSSDVKRRALLRLFSDYFSQNRLRLIDFVNNLNFVKIKDFISFVQGIFGDFLLSQGFSKDLSYNKFNKVISKYRFLIILDKDNFYLRKSLSNIPWVDFVIFDNISVYKLFYSHFVFLEKSLFLKMLKFYLANLKINKFKKIGSK